MRKLIFLILIVPILTFSSGLKRISHYFGDSSIYAIMKSDDGYIFREYRDCLLYTSPSPRD